MNKQKKKKLVPFCHMYGLQYSPQKKEELTEEEFRVDNSMIIRQIQLAQNFPITPAGAKFAHSTRQRVVDDLENLKNPSMLFIDCLDKFVKKEIPKLNPNIFKTSAGPDFV